MFETSVLIVDDHKLIRDTWQFIIESKHIFKVTGSTGNAGEALNLAKTLKPRIILMDINMYPIDGFQLTEEIFTFSPSQFIIGVSMYMQPLIVKKFMALGCRGYVTKNSSPDEMILALTEVSNGRRYVSMDIREAMLEAKDKQSQKNIFSARELEIINGIRDGLTSGEIAAKLGMSKRTAEAHRYNIFKKLQVKNSVSLVKIAAEMGL